MNTILGVVKNGRIEVDAPPGWPDGSPVRVELGLNGAAPVDDEQPETPEDIEERIRRLDAIEPIKMTLEEQASWEAALKAQNHVRRRYATRRDCVRVGQLRRGHQGRRLERRARFER
jgi:hypothetical protein